MAQGPSRHNQLEKFNESPINYKNKKYNFTQNVGFNKNMFLEEMKTKLIL